jgi:undecaprenyl diphosphate synthase
MDNRVRLVHAGRRERLAPKTLALLDETIALTRDNAGMALCLAISYGGRQELVDAVRALARDVAAGRLAADAVDEAAVSARLYQPALPDPDLLIRTAGELRVSNFLLWQIQYAEIWVTPVCWPEFGKEQLHAAFADYGRRVRKFGKVQ